MCDAVQGLKQNKDDISLTSYAYAQVCCLQHTANFETNFPIEIFKKKLRSKKNDFWQ